MQAAYILQDRAVLTLLGNLRDAVGRDGHAAIFREIGRRVSGFFLIEYPPATGAKMSDLWTPKQRRYFFWALKEGKIQVPYQRTGQLKGALTAELKLVEDHAVLTLSIPESNSASKYAPYLIGSPAQQSRYFKQRTNWKPLAVQIQKRMAAFETLVQFATESVIRDIGGLGNAPLFASGGA